MNKRHYLGIAVIAVILLAIASVYAISSRNATSASLPNSTSSGTAISSPVVNHPNPEPQQPPSGEAVTIVGTIECIAPEADASGRQTQNCAVGIKSDDGKSYGLYSEDATKMVGLPTGQRAQVSGTLAKPNAQQANTEGIIHISTIEKL